jgi:hypothetical protein
MRSSNITAKSSTIACLQAVKRLQKGRINNKSMILRTILEMKRTFMSGSVTTP